MFSILFASLAAASSVRGGTITDASRDFSIERDQDVLRLLEPNYNPEDTTNLTSRSVLDALLNRRQSCSPGYGYCSAFGKCCPSTDRCCSYGYCVPPGETCCAPLDAVCCGDNIGWCEAGNHCYKVEGQTRDVCCTDSSCTARVSGGTTITVGSGGSGGSGTTPPPVPTPTATEVVAGYYYFTITWTYYVYYWYYSIAIEASVVTSSVTTTSDSVRVTASNSAAASAAFASISATYSPYTPPAATSLKSLAGSTSSGSSLSTPTFSTPSFTTPTFGGTPRPFGANGAGTIRGGLVGGDLVGAFFFIGAGAIAIAMVML